MPKTTRRSAEAARRRQSWTTNTSTRRRTPSYGWRTASSGPSALRVRSRPDRRRLPRLGTLDAAWSGLRPPSGDALVAVPARDPVGDPGFRLAPRRAGAKAVPGVVGRGAAPGPPLRRTSRHGARSIGGMLPTSVDHGERRDRHAGSLPVQSCPRSAPSGRGRLIPVIGRRRLSKEITFGLGFPVNGTIVRCALNPNRLRTRVSSDDR